MSGPTDAPQAAQSPSDQAPLKFFLATPLHDGRVHHSYMMGAAQLVAAFPARVVVAQFKSSFLPATREKLTLQFLESDATHLLCVDQDMGWTATDVQALASANEDFVTAIYARRQADLAPDAVFLETRRGDLIEVAHTGVAFSLLSRRCIERLMSGYPELHYQTPTGPGCALWSPTFGGKYYAEDLSFCARHRALGGRIWAHSRVVLKRHGERTYWPSGFEPQPSSKGRR